MFRLAPAAVLAAVLLASCATVPPPDAVPPRLPRAIPSPTPFSTATSLEGLPEGWRKYRLARFKKFTDYRLVRTPDQGVVIELRTGGRLRIGAGIPDVFRCARVPLARLALESAEDDRRHAQLARARRGLPGAHGRDLRRRARQAAARRTDELRPCQVDCRHDIALRHADVHLGRHPALWRGRAAQHVFAREGDRGGQQGAARNLGRRKAQPAERLPARVSRGTAQGRWRSAS